MNLIRILLLFLVIILLSPSTSLAVHTNGASSHIVQKRSIRKAQSRQIHVLQRKMKKKVKQKSPWLAALFILLTLVGALLLGVFVFSAAYVIAYDGNKWGDVLLIFGWGLTLIATFLNIRKIIKNN